MHAARQRAASSERGSLSWRESRRDWTPLAAPAEAPAKGKGKKAAKVELPDASLKWGEGVEEKK